MVVRTLDAGADVWLMAATAADAADFAARCRAVGITPAGVIVEVPADAAAARSAIGWD